MLKGANRRERKEVVFAAEKIKQKLETELRLLINSLDLNIKNILQEKYLFLISSFI